jgi:hypothetical protein
LFFLLLRNAGVSFVRGKVCQSLFVSYQHTIKRLAAVLHAADPPKLAYQNAMGNARRVAAVLLTSAVSALMGCLRCSWWSMRVAAVSA